MQDFIELFLIRPVSALLSSLQMLGEDLPLMVQMDAMISRATQILSSPAGAQFQIVDRNTMNVATEQGLASSGKEPTRNHRTLRDREE